ncbi:TetR/AcrR family transcriptional regulator [Thiotrichales bacterium 19S11-10]|nr:TetR/AcrR family transcriptional regulator [Thiotrichales bacterium 19S11-10]
MKVTQKRAYNSESRKEKAQQSRIKILDKARLLFIKKGFEQVKINDIAKASEVSDQTIYALFKSKIGILRAIMDECFPQLEHSLLVEASKNEKDPKKRLAISAKIARRIYEAEQSQMALFQGASILSPEFKQLETEREKRRHERLSETIGELYTAKVLDKNLTQRKALDIFWALTGRDLYRLFVIEQKWSPDDYEKWLAKMLIKALL